MWKAVGNSVPGNSHVAAGLGCDDAYGWRIGADATCFIVADGAGSAENSAVGSHAAIAAALDWLHRSIVTDDGVVPSLADCFRVVRKELEALAARDGVSLQSLSTTLGVFWQIGDEVQICQIGDTIVVVRSVDGEYTTINPPEKFEYVNEAVFLTSDSAFDHFRSHTMAAHEVTAVALSTDGLRFKILADLATFEPFPPFFDDIFAFAAKPKASNASISKFLNSIEDQSGDDKTLVIGVRQNGSVEHEQVVFGPDPSLVGRHAPAFQRPSDSSGSDNTVDRGDRTDTGSPERRLPDARRPRHGIHPRVHSGAVTSWLEVDDSLRPSSKATSEEMRQWMATVPDIYSRLAAGTTDAEFHEMYEHPRDQHERIMGETYKNLFTPSQSAQPIKATWVDGRGLVVDAGQHRVLAAREAGVPLMPVHVAAPDDVTFYRIRAACEDETARTGPARIIDVQRKYDEALYPDRTPLRVPDRHPGIERLEPTREERFRYPERER